MKKLGESDSDDESASAWVQKSRALAKEKELAEKKVCGWAEYKFIKGEGVFLDYESLTGIKLDHVGLGAQNYM